MVKITLQKTVIIIAIALVSASCATKKEVGEQFVPSDMYDLSLSYDKKLKAFMLELKSYADEEICIPEMNWTDEKGGHYFFGDKRVYFLYGDVRYDMRVVSYSDYCTAVKVNDCMKILKKGNQIIGKLPIKDFSAPSEVYLSKDFEPRLHYSYTPRYCVTK